MAAINDLVNQIENPELRERIQREIDWMNKQKRQTEIDIMGKQDKNTVLFGKCKWTMKNFTSAYLKP